MLDFNTLVELALSLLTALVGYPSAVSFVMFVLEKVKWLSPEKEDVFNFWANCVGFVAIAVAVFFGKFDLINQIDAELGQAVKWLIELLTLLGIPYGFAQVRRLHAHLAEAFLY